MPNKFDEAFAKVQKLAIIFESGKDRYLSSDYQEAEVRKDFIDKFFTALGWDVNHDEQTNPYAQEVKVERGVNEGLARKRADYAFLLAPNFRDVRFYVEAKRPSKDFGCSDNYHQAIRYGWFTKKTSPFAVLTSFEDFHILDCRLKPNINDTLSRVVERFTYTDYADAEKFSRIYWLFSREAVAGGSLEKLAASRPISKAKRYQRGLFKGGDTRPDEDFLEELDGYREQLAQAFKRANPDLDGETLTEVTQRTLDRLVFTRFLEDKGIESSVIENFGKQDGFWEDFINASLRLDRKYNGVVFKFHPRLDVKGFKPDEKVFARICEELTDPTSPYNFNVIPIHILGSIYERFLGKVISDGAKVVEKPEVRKAGGVYYTPEYIVRYIVENTVGKMIEGKTPEEISKLKFADIACGSGSFLLGVYDVLLKYHAEYYSKNPGKVRKGDCVRRDGTLHLSLQKKRDILTNNLYGVDIDRQAVEVAQLSLYLKLLEDETVGTTSVFQDEFHFTLLPSLDKNIVCGNSLIGPDIADGGALTDEEEKKINPLDYAQRFPAIFRRRISSGELREAAPGDVEHNYPGGMPLHGSYAKVSYKKSKKEKTAPPAVPESEYEGGFDAIVGNPPYGAELNAKDRNYLQKKFGVSITDTAALFILQQLRLLKSNALGGYIVPKPLIYASNWKEIRAAMMPGLLEMCDCSKVWREVKLEQVVYRLQKDAKQKAYKSSVRKKETIVALGDIQKQLCDEFAFILSNVSPVEVALALKLKRSEKHLPQIGVNRRGAMLQKKVRPAAGEFKVVGGKQVARYGPAKVSKGCVSQKDVTDGNAYVGANSVLVQNIVAHIQKPVDHIQIIATVLPANERKQSIILDTVNQISIVEPWSCEFVAGLLNSNLINWFVYRFIYARAIRTMHFDAPVTDRIPLPVMDLKNAADKSRHDRLVKLVEQMLVAKAKLPSTKTEHDREFYTNKCATLDQQIDALVYELYNLTEEEINLVKNP